jgi:hypothetical protein
VAAFKARQRAFNKKVNSGLSGSHLADVAAARGAQKRIKKGKKGESKAGGEGGGEGGRNPSRGGDAQRSGAKGVGKPKVCYFHNMEIRSKPGFSRKAGKTCNFEQARVSVDELEKLRLVRARSVSKAPSERSQGLDKSDKSKGRARSPSIGGNQIWFFSRLAAGKPCKNTPCVHPRLSKEEIKAKKFERKNATAATTTAKTERQTSWGWGFRPCPGSRRCYQLRRRWVCKAEVGFILVLLPRRLGIRAGEAQEASHALEHRLVPHCP